MFCKQSSSLPSPRLADPAAIAKTEAAVKAKATSKSATASEARALAARTKLVLLEQRADVRTMNNRGWREAFALANQFLIDQQLQHTLATTLAEFPNFTRFASDTSGSQSSEHFEALVQQSDSSSPPQRKSRQVERRVPEDTVPKGRRQVEIAPSLARPAVAQDLFTSSAPGESDG
jgi:hypothetical protein